MQTRSVATVFGGSGFIGRYIVKRLAAQGYVVRVAVRDPEGSAFLKPMGAVGQIVPLAASITDDAAVARAVAGAEIVVNAIGILTEPHPGDFMQIQGEGPGRVARAAAAAGVSQLVHLSAIGADRTSKSQYAAYGSRSCHRGKCSKKPVNVNGLHRRPEERTASDCLNSVQESSNATSR